MITVNLNGESHQVPAGTTLAQLLERHDDALDGQTPQQIATAVNECYVARNQRAAHQLHNGDTVVTFSPITGG